MKNLDVLRSIQRALLGHVTPNLRAVYTYEKEDGKHLDFYYNFPPPEEEEELASLTHTYFFADYPDANIFYEILVIPYPQRIPTKDGLCAYRRYEKDVGNVD